MSKRVSEQLAAYISGDNNAPPEIKSWARLHIYHEAVRILALPQPERLEQIERYGRPVELRAEVLRVNRWRKENGL